MTRLAVLVLPGVLLATLGAPYASAQEPVPPAHVAYVEGRAVLEHETTSEDVEPNLPLDTGDRLRTERGRVEVLFGDGSILQLDEETTIDLLSDSLVRQLRGRLAIVAGSGSAGRLQVDTPAGSVRITRAGEFRVSVFEESGVPEIEVAVIRGNADLFTESGTVSIGAGARALARQGESPSAPMSFNSARWDAFDRWSQERLSLRRGAASHGYIPPPLRPYGAVLDTYGSWNYEPSYGYVWFPHVVSGWRPYYHGRWRFYTRFGWTWIGGDAWGWPTHHYGRWGTTAAGAWFWVPGRTWGPAWVHWAVAPGYVSWCPLGFDGRPVVPFGYAYASRGHYRRDPWAAWTVVRRDHFGGYGPVRRVAVDGRRFSEAGMRPFVLRTTPPERPYAVPRSAGAAGAASAAGGFAASRPSSGVAVTRASSASGRQTAATGDSGRAVRSGSRLPERPTAVRRGAPEAPSVEAGRPVLSRRGTDARPVREPGHGGHYGSAVSRRALVDATADPGTSVPRGARPAWNADSVPVYRGGSLTPPRESAGADTPDPTHPGVPRRAYAEGTAGPSRRSGIPPPSSAGPATSDPRLAVPRGGPPSYGPQDDPRSSGQRRPSHEPSISTPPAPQAGERGGAGPRYREAPGSPSTPPPTAAPRQAPDGGGSRIAAPRGGDHSRGAPPPPSRPPAGGAQPSRRR